MKPETKILLTRWKNLESEDGLQKIRSFCLGLQIGTLLLIIFIGIACYHALPLPIIIIASLAAGWLIAERNALESRLKQWPELKQYLDWEKVDRDLNNSKSSPGI